MKIGILPSQVVSSVMDKEDDFDKTKEIEDYRHALAKLIEDHKHELSKKTEDYKDVLTSTVEKRRLESERLMRVWHAIFEYAQIAIRTVILANGFGATAILTFLGNTLKNGTTALPITRDLGLAAGVFALGVAAGLLATIFAYFSQYNLVKIALDTGIIIVPGTRWERKAGIICVLVGLLTFLFGVGWTIKAYVTL